MSHIDFVFVLGLITTTTVNTRFISQELTYFLYNLISPLNFKVINHNTFHVTIIDFIDFLFVSQRGQAPFSIHFVIIFLMTITFNTLVHLQFWLNNIHME